MSSNLRAKVEALDIHPGTDYSFESVRAFRDRVLDLIDECSSVETSDEDARDAARYRLLRRGNDYQQAGPMVVLCEQEHIESDDRPLWVLAEQALDVAVDSALGITPEEPTPCHPDPTGKTREPPHCPSCSCGMTP